MKRLGFQNKEAITKMWAIVIAAIVVVAAVGGGAAYFMLSGPSQTEETEIRLGMGIGLTGSYAGNAIEYTRSVQFWAKEVNEAGGIFIKQYNKKLPVKLIIYDDQSSADTSVKLYEKLITEDKVVAVFGPFSSTVTMAVSAVTEKYHIPMIGGSAAANNMFERNPPYEYLFSMCALATNSMIATLNMLANRTDLNPKPTKVGIAVSQALFSMYAATGAKWWFGNQTGMQLVYYQEYAPSPKDVSDIIIAAKAANVDVFLNWGQGTDAGIFAKQAKELGFRPKAFGFAEGPEMPWFVSQFGHDADGLLGRLDLLWNPNDAMVKAFVDRFSKYYGLPKDQVSAGWHGRLYSGAQALQQAIEKAGTLNSDDIAKAMRTETFTNILVGSQHLLKWSILPDGKRYLDTYLAQGVMQVQNLTMQQIWPVEMQTTSQIVYPLPPLT